jgi:hypothetical protein
MKWTLLALRGGREQLLVEREGLGGGCRRRSGDAGRRSASISSA